MKRLLSLFTVLCLPVAAEEAAFVSSRTLSMDTANKLVMAAAHHCTKKGYQVSVAVTDRSGNLLAFIKNPLAGSHTIDVAILKAKTAASFQTPTLEMMQGFDRLRDAPNVLLIGGGVPVKLGGHMYGAVGVSGAPRKKVTGDMDHECGQQGIEAVREALEFAQ
ncbi:MAG: heme-binding protein [Gammaproteobacteria bacterium]|nr:heme-binding protein [Gammaproteobacteria bacterium]